MKSAYEIALARMEAESGPSRKLSEAAKEAIAEIEKKYDAKVAETKLAFENKLTAAPYAERPKIQEELAKELASLEERREMEKNAVWDRQAP